MQKKNIIFFPFHDLKKWEKEGYRTRDSHIFSEMVKRTDIENIVLINRPISIYENQIKKIPKYWTGSQILKKNSNYTLSRINSKTFVLDYHPKDKIFPLIENKDWWTRAYNSNELYNTILKCLNFLQIQQIDGIYSNVVNNHFVVKRLKEYFNSNLVFDIVDDQSKIAKHKRYKKSLDEGYQLYSKISDTIIGTSISMEKKIGRNIIEISNGVNVQHFCREGSLNIREKLNLPAENKIILYTGKIHDRIDYLLVNDMATAIKKASFVFCGPILNKKKFKETLSKNPNIFWFGDLHYNDLPLAIKESDICIIPHLNNEITKSQSPLKLLEYIASGKPVISTNINGVDRSVENDVFIFKDNSGFIKKIEDLMQKDYIVKSEIPEQESWEYKVSLIMQYM